MSNFDKIAKDYESIIDDTLAIKGENLHQYFAEYKSYYIEGIINSTFKKNGRLKLLDYGCGVGALSNEIYKRLSDKVVIHGYDISEESINKISDSLNTGDNRFTSNISELDYNYDVIILCNVMHHVPIQDRKEVFRIIHEHLSNKGSLIVIEHNMLNPLTKKSVDKCPFDADAHMLKMKEMSALLFQNDYRISSKRFITFFPPKLSKLRFIDYFLSWIPFGAQYMICAQKEIE